MTSKLRVSVLSWKGYYREMVWVLFSILFIMYLLDTNKKTIVISGRNWNPAYTSKNYVVFFTLVLVLVSAIRGDTVGVDTPSYLWSFLRGDYMNIMRSNLLSETEFGFLLIQKIVATMGLGFRSLLVFCSLLTIVPIGIYILNNSDNPFASFFVYITLDYYFFSMTGLRQSLAIGICILSLRFVKEKKLIWYLVLVLTACTIHKTAAIFLPVYFLSRLQIKRKHVITILCVGMLLFALKSPIRSIMRMFARIDYGAMNTGGTGYYLLMVAIVFVFLYLADTDAKRDSSINISLNMVIIAILLFPILQYNPTALRLHYYYSIALIILIPNTISRIRDSKIRFGIGTMFFVVSMYYFAFYTSNNMGVLPYSLCFN